MIFWRQYLWRRWRYPIVKTVITKMMTFWIREVFSLIWYRQPISYFTLPRSLFPVSDQTPNLVFKLSYNQPINQVTKPQQVNQHIMQPHTGRWTKDRSPTPPNITTPLPGPDTHIGYDQLCTMTRRQGYVTSWRPTRQETLLRAASPRACDAEVSTGVCGIPSSRHTAPVHPRLRLNRQLLRVYCWRRPRQLSWRGNFSWPTDKLHGRLNRTPQ